MDKILENLNGIWMYFSMIRAADVLDILIVAYLIYKLYTLLRNTTAWQVVKGIMLFLGVTVISNLLNMHVISFILGNTMQLGVLALVIMFQPELRKMLEQVGRSRLPNLYSRDANHHDTEQAIIQTVEACTALSKTHIGALIVFERKNMVNDVVKTGTMIDASVSSELLKNIFYPKAPLHDGAVIIRAGRVISAGCMLPLTSNTNLSRELGMRHRAGIGMTENADAVVVIVSEETGSISVASGGIVKRHLTPETLQKLLSYELIPEDGESGKSRKIFGIFKVKKHE